jgi:hypothetical protein
LTTPPCLKLLTYKKHIGQGKQLCFLSIDLSNFKRLALNAQYLVIKPQAKEKSPRSNKPVYFIIRKKLTETKTAYVSNIYYHERDFELSPRRIRGQRCNFGNFGTDRLSRNVVKKLPILLAK